MYAPYPARSSSRPVFRHEYNSPRVPITGRIVIAAEREWHLRRASGADAEGLHALVCVPEVYRFLADGAAPPRALVERWIELGESDAIANGLGLWILEDRDATLGGCVRLEMRPEAHSAELTYLLNPRFWGQGLATRMSWTVMELAFGRGQIAEIVAGADAPNTASVGVMRRLGMTYLRHVQYPAGPGVEYVYRRGDPAPVRAPRIPLR